MISMSEKPETKKDDKFVIRGTIKHLKIEGGFFGIIGEDGNKYRPINLPKDYQKAGLKVEVEARLRGGMMSIHMWGKNIEIISIKKA